MDPISHNVRYFRKLRGMTQAELAKAAGTTQYTVSEIELAHREPHPATLRKLAAALGIRVADFYGEAEVPKKAPAPPSQRSLFNGLEEERRSSRFSEAIIGAAAKWGEAVANPDMRDTKRFGIIDAALQLSGVISEQAEEEDWEAIPNQERLEIVTTMEKLTEVAEQGIRHLEESGEARTQEEEVKQRREQMRELTRRISA